MAKVSGPLMSMDARGKFGNAIVFSGWKGRPTVRQLVTPSNPQSQIQQDARNIVRVGGAAQKVARLTTTKRAGYTTTDLVQLKAAAPSGFAWNGNLVKTMAGSGAVNYAAAVAAYAALSSGEKTAWTNAAAAHAPIVPDVAQYDALGVLGTPIGAGEVWFIYQYTLYLLGLSTVPGGTPPVYA